MMILREKILKKKNEERKNCKMHIKYKQETNVPRVLYVYCIHYAYALVADNLLHDNIVCKSRVRLASSAARITHVRG